MKAKIAGLLLCSALFATMPLPAAAGDPLDVLVGAGFGAAFGHAVGGHDGAVAGGVIGAIAGAAASDYDRGRTYNYRDGYPRPAYYVEDEYWYWQPRYYRGDWDDWRYRHNYRDHGWDGGHWDHDHRDRGHWDGGNGHGDGDHWRRH